MASGLYLCRFGNGFWREEDRVKTGASPELSKTIVLIKPTPAHPPPLPLILITISLPCAFCHHALGTVLNVQSEGVALVESKRNISSIVFLPILDGMIEKGDLLGVINVFPIIVNR